MRRARSHNRERLRRYALSRFLQNTEEPLVSGLGRRMTAARGRAEAAKRRRRTAERQADLRALFYDRDETDPRYNGFQFWKEVFRDVEDAEVRNMLAESGDRLGMVARMAALEAKGRLSRRLAVRPAYRYMDEDENDETVMEEEETMTNFDDVTSVSSVTADRNRNKEDEEAKNKKGRMTSFDDVPSFSRMSESRRGIAAPSTSSTKEEGKAKDLDVIISASNVAEDKGLSAFGSGGSAAVVNNNNSKEEDEVKNNEEDVEAKELEEARDFRHMDMDNFNKQF